MIPYGRQSIAAADVEAVLAVLNSDWLTQGPAVERFERAVADYCGASYAVAVNSATSALHIACLAAGLGAGDALWTSPNSFVASANCGRYCGAAVDFVDIDPASYNLSPEALEAKLEKAAAQGRLPKVLIPVHFSGQPCRLREIAQLCARYGITVIEDASHAVGGRYLDGRIGNCLFSAMTVFSFHPVKIITTGEGGMVLTNDRELYQRLVRLRSHGIVRDPQPGEPDGDAPWMYRQVELGCNYRLTDLQAALGLSQLARLDEFVARRHELAHRYDRALASLPLTLPAQSPEGYSSYHLYVVRLKLDRLRPGRREVFQRLRDRGILVNVHYIPIHTQPYYRELGFRPGDFPEAESYYRETITLPLYPALSEAQQDEVIAALKEALT